MATIKDVAKAARVSVATVSAVVNGTKYVSEALANRVRNTIERTGYHPHGIARSLKSGSTQTIGLIITDITNPFFTAVARSIEDAAHAAGYTVMLCNTDEDITKETAYLRIMRSRYVDGLILATAGDAKAYRSFQAGLPTPVVLLDRVIRGLALDAVVVDNASATRRAIEHLIGLGHRRVALITGLPHLSTSRERLRGYVEALRANGIEPTADYVVQGNFRVREAYVATKILLGRSTRPTAIFASNNLMAIGLLKAARDLGLRCPEDLSVASFDDFEEASLFSPGLTTVAQPTEAIGRKAVELLLRRINDRAHAGPSELAMMEAQLKVRGSCGPPCVAQAPEPDRKANRSNAKAVRSTTGQPKC